MWLLVLQRKFWSLNKLIFNFCPSENGVIIDPDINDLGCSSRSWQSSKDNIDLLISPCFFLHSDLLRPGIPLFLIFIMGSVRGRRDRNVPAKYKVVSDEENNKKILVRNSMKAENSGWRRGVGRVRAQYFLRWNFFLILTSDSPIICCQPCQAVTSRDSSHEVAGGGWRWLGASEQRSVQCWCTEAAPTSQSQPWDRARETID